jgi:hypothetical protein
MIRLLFAEHSRKNESHQVGRGDSYTEGKTATLWGAEYDLGAEEKGGKRHEPRWKEAGVSFPARLRPTRAQRGAGKSLAGSIKHSWIDPAPATDLVQKVICRVHTSINSQSSMATADLD